MIAVPQRWKQVLVLGGRFLVHYVNHWPVNPAYLVFSRLRHKIVKTSSISFHCVGHHPLRPPTLHIKKELPLRSILQRDHANAAKDRTAMGKRS